MIEQTILLPLIIIFTAALIAALFGLPSLNRRLTAPQLGWFLAVAPLAVCGDYRW